MQEITQFNTQLTKQRRSSTILVGVLLTCGFSAAVPMFNDSIKHTETLFCNIKTECRGSSIKRGISYLIDRERRNQLFDNSIKVVKVLPPEDDKAVYFGAAASLFLLTAYGISKALTDNQEKAIHSQFKLLKIKALENDLLESTHIDLFGFSKSNQAEITKQAIARHTQETIQAMKSEGEVQLDHLNGQLQGTLSIKSHQLQVSELDKETAKNELETAEIKRKLDKINKPVSDAKPTSANEELKTVLIDALKGHEDGYLWKIISSLKPLWLIGAAGSGKTYTSAAIALIRKYCLDADIHLLADRHYTGENSKVWGYLQPKNTAETEEEITAAFQDLARYWMDRIKAKPTNKTQTVIDEFTHLRTLTGEVADTVFKLSLSDCRKAQNMLLGVTHNDTNESFAPGTEATRKAGMILLQKFSADGERPLSRVVVRYGLVDEAGNELKDVEKSLPSWFHPEKIHQHFNGKPMIFEE
jgi:hypothetical protein